MKKHLLAALFVLPGVQLFAQCTINTSYTTPGIYPDTLPTATVGQPYSTDITFMMPLDTMGYDFTNFHILTVTLPVGLNWACNSMANNCNYDPQVYQYGCANISGTPLLAGFYAINVTVIADLTVASGIPVNFVVYLNVLPSTASSSNNGFAMTGYSGCAPITVTFTNNNPGLMGYFWDFGNSNQSTAENPVPQVYTQPGDYIVHYEAYSDTTTQHFYTLTSIDISSIQNSASVWGYPIDGNPDLFVIVKENGTPVYQSPYFADQFPPVGWTGLNINMNPANTYLLEVWDEDDFEFGFGADDFVGSHTMSLNGCTGCAANISVVNYSVTHTIVGPQPSVITDDTVHVYGFPGEPNIYFDSLNHVLHTDSISNSLQWYLNGSPLLGSNLPTDTVLVSGDYFVVTINSNGCAAFSDTITAIWCDTTWHPGVIDNLTSLSTIDTTGNTLQWYLNGNPIPGATNDNVATSTNGVYTLEVTNSFGCHFYSWPFLVSVGIEEAGITAPVVFPNPATNSVQVRWSNPGASTVIELKDMTGRIVSRTQTTGDTQTISTEELPAGTYFVVVTSGEKTGVTRLVIAR